MSKQRLKTGVAVGAAALAIVGFGAPMLVRAADHLDAPGKFQSPKGRHDADINDVYAFPAGSDDTVLAMTTHPALGVVTTQTAYATDVLYKINVADAKNNVETFVVKFGAVRNDGTQKYTVTLSKNGRNKQLGSGVTGQNTSLGGDQRAFAGPRSDPFFFDLDAFNNTVHATGGRGFCANGQGVDFFAGLNTNAIVLKVNNDVVGTKVNIWGSTVSTDGKTQYDRMGRPAINTVFNGFKEVFNTGVDADKDTFNAIRNPLNDPTTKNGLFTKNVITILQGFSSLSGTPYTDKEAADLAKVLLPDRLPYDTSDHVTNGVFNGRALTDDVIDTELNVVTKGAVPSDCVAAHTDYLSAFPFLGVPHP
jgi:uncharacterized protein DUF4331